MVQPDPALGFVVDFPTDLFNNAIKFAMQMGTPIEEAKRVTFLFSGNGSTYWKDGVELTTPPAVDLDGHPYDPEIEMRRSEDVRVQVDCAVEIEDVIPDREEPVGTFQQTKLTITLLEAEYQQVKGCKAVEYNGDRYVYGFDPVNYGLFDANVHQMIFMSEDDS